jgi:hypothetical protein
MQPVTLGAAVWSISVVGVVMLTTPPLITAFYRI